MLTLRQNINKAIELGSKNYFTSKAQQKRALDYLNNAYYCIKNAWVITGSTPDERYAKIVDIPNDLHLVREKHRPLFKNVSMDSELIFYLQQCRNLFKNYEILPPQKNDDLRILMDIINMTATRDKEYPQESQRNLEHYIGKELFKRVSYTWHFVTNSHGTRFTRVFWFFDGKLTKLSIILAMRG
tara:strand:- start:498 stop:1052 length:555 start_codon:yes stop_codon:yes gene_type:complete